MPTSYNDNPPEPTLPVANENAPGLGRNSKLLEQQRANGGLSDDSPENPVRDDNPLRITRER